MRQFLKRLADWADAFEDSLFGAAFGVWFLFALMFALAQFGGN